MLNEKRKIIFFETNIRLKKQFSQGRNKFYIKYLTKNNIKKLQGLTEGFYLK